MRLKIRLNSERKIVLKKGYFKAIQWLIYNLLDRAHSNWLHDKGFKYEKRSFKLFVFSEIFESGNSVDDVFIFPDTISFMLASPVDWILEEVAKNVIIGSEILLENNRLFLSEINVLPPVKLNGDRVRVRALSPIEVHSTLFKKDGGKKTYHYNPFEKEFSQYVNENLKKKWKVFLNEEPPGDISIHPVKFKCCKPKKITLMGTSITGWKGQFYLEGNRDLIKFAFDVGLGSRNSLGFGMVEPVKQRI